MKWTPLSRPKNDDPSLHSHQAFRALVPRHAAAGASSPSDRSRFSLFRMKATTTNLVPSPNHHLSLVALVPRHAAAGASSPSDRSRFSLLRMKATTTNLVP